MNGLINLRWDRSIRLDQIEGISATMKDGEKTTYRLRLADNDISETITADQQDRIQGYPLQLIPAQSGTYALHADVVDGEVQHHQVPVISWARCLDGSIRIVTPAGIDDGHVWSEGSGYVLMPNGTVQAVSEYIADTSFPTLTAYLAHVLDQAKAMEAVR